MVEPPLLGWLIFKRKEVCHCGEGAGEVNSSNPKTGCGGVCPHPPIPNEGLCALAALSLPPLHESLVVRLLDFSCVPEAGHGDWD